MQCQKRTSQFAMVLALFCSPVLPVSGLFSPASGGDRASPSPGLRILDGQPKTVVVQGFSTSFYWPTVLQRKLDRYFDGRRVVEVKTATQGGTPLARWIDVKSGRRTPAWERIVKPALTQDDRVPVIVLGQQTLQLVFGRRAVSIRDEKDTERIRQGADALETYVRALRADGADLVIVAMHIYKHPMEPGIGNERHALTALIRRGIEGVEAGPDVWTPMKKLYPIAYAKDRLHPNSIGAEVMAQKWFETLLKRDRLPVPAWSLQELKDALRQPPVRLRRIGTRAGEQPNP